MSQPRLLIVSATFPPSLLIGGRRPARMARHLRHLGWQVTVLTVHPSYMPPRDPAEAPPPGVEIVATHVLSPRAWARQLRRRQEGQAPGQPTATVPTTGWRAQVHGVLHSAFKAIEFPDEFAGWRPLALRAIADRTFDVVLGSMPPFSDAVVAHAIAQRCGARLVLDYRDPWSEVLSEDASYGERRAYSQTELQRHRALENRLLRDASLVLGASPRICSWLQARTPVPVQLLPNGLDAAPPVAPPPRTLPLRLVYAGSLAYDRSLDSLLAALAALRAEFAPDALRFVYAGPHGAQLRAAAQQHGVLDYVDDLGVLPRDNVLELYQGAAAGVAAVSARMHYCYPGKLFEILGAGCRVLMCGPKDADALELVRALGVGETDDGSDPQASVLALRNLLVAPGTPLQGLESWVASEQMLRLDGLLRGLPAAGQAGA